MIIKNISIVLAGLMTLSTIVSGCEKEIQRPEVTEPLMPDLGPEGTAGTIGSAEVTRTTVFSAAANNEVFRIPSVITAKDGSILVFAEDRHESWRDKSYTDVVVKRSTDNGKTWSAAVSITGSLNAGDFAFMDPTPVLDENTGTIYLFCNRWNELNTDYTNNRAFMSKSTDHGATWSNPVDVTDQIVNAGMYCGGFGPGHGIMIKEGRYAGRLVLITRQNSATGSGNCYAIYSDDGGSSWSIGGAVSSGEAQIAEAGEDKLYINIRRGAARYSSFSLDGGASWSAAQQDVSLPSVDGGCQASVLGTGSNMVFYCGPESGAASDGHDNRYGLKLFRSATSGSGWTRSQVLYEMASGYSDMTLLQDGRMAIIFEAGDEKGFIKTSNRVPGWLRLDLMVLPAEITDYDYWFE